MKLKGKIHTELNAEIIKWSLEWSMVVADTKIEAHFICIIRSERHRFADAP